MPRIIEIAAKDLDPRRKYSPFPCSLKITGAVPAGVTLSIASGDLWVEGDVADRVTLLCTGKISVTGNMGLGCYVKANVVLVTGCVEPSTFEVSESIQLEGAVIYECQALSSQNQLKQYKLAVKGRPKSVSPLGLLECMSAVATENKRPAPAAFFQPVPKEPRRQAEEEFNNNTQQAVVNIPEELPDIPDIGILNRLTFPKNIPEKLAWLQQGIVHMHNGLAAWHAAIQNRQEAKFNVQGREIELRPYQLKKLTEFCNTLMQADMQQDPCLFKAVLELPTGAGKTFVFLLAIELLMVGLREQTVLPFKTLIVEPFIDLKTQTKKSGKEYVPELIIKGYKKNQPLTAATTITYQLFSKLAQKDNFGNFLAQFNFIVFDEAHQLFAESYQKKILAKVIETCPIVLLATASPIKDEKNSLYKLLGFANPGEQPMIGEKINPLSQATLVELSETENLAPVKAPVVQVVLETTEENRITAQNIGDELQELPFLNRPENIRMLVDLIVNGENHETQQRFLGLYGVIKSRDTANANAIVAALNAFVAENTATLAPIIDPLKQQYQSEIEKKVISKKEMCKKKNKKFNEATYRATFLPFQFAAAYVAEAFANKSDRKKFNRSLQAGGIQWCVGNKMLGTGKNIPFWAVGIGYAPDCSWIAHVQFFGRIMRKHGDKTAYAICFYWGHPQQVLFLEQLGGKTQVGKVAKTVMLPFAKLSILEKTNYALQWESGSVQQFYKKSSIRKTNPSATASQRQQPITQQEQKISEQLKELKKVLQQLQTVVAQELPEIRETKLAANRPPQNSNVENITTNNTAASQPTAVAQNEMDQSEPTPMQMEVPTTIPVINNNQVNTNAPEVPEVSPALLKEINDLSTMIKNLWEVMYVDVADETEIADENPAAILNRQPSAQAPYHLNNAQLAEQKLRSLKQQLAAVLRRQHAAIPHEENQDEDSVLEKAERREEVEDILNAMLATVTQLPVLVRQIIGQHPVRQLQPQAKVIPAPAPTQPSAVVTICEVSTDLDLNAPPDEVVTNENQVMALSSDTNATNQANELEKLEAILFSKLPSANNSDEEQAIQQLAAELRGESHATVLTEGVIVMSIGFSDQELAQYCRTLSFSAYGFDCPIWIYLAKIRTVPISSTTYLFLNNDLNCPVQQIISGLNLRKGSLERTIFRDRVIRDNNFNSVNLNYAMWSNIDVSQMKFIDCSLKHATFQKNNFYKTLWRECDVEANFQQVVFKQCKFEGNKNVNKGLWNNAVFFMCEISDETIELIKKSVANNKETPLFICDIGELIKQLAVFSERNSSPLKFVLYSLAQWCVNNKTVVKLLPEDVITLQYFLNTAGTLRVTATDFLSCLKQYKKSPAYKDNPFKEFFATQFLHTFILSPTIPVSSALTDSKDDLKGLDLSEINMQHCKFNDLDLIGIKLRNAKASFAFFKDVDLTNADLRVGDFSCAIFSNVIFHLALVQDMNCIKALFYKSSIFAQGLGSAFLWNAIFIDCTYVVAEDVRKKGAFVFKSIDDLCDQIENFPSQMPNEFLFWNSKVISRNRLLAVGQKVLRYFEQSNEKENWDRLKEVVEKGLLTLNTHKPDFNYAFSNNAETDNPVIIPQFQL